MDRLTRRRLLGLCSAAAAGVAGCSAESGSQAGTAAQQGSPSTNGTTTPATDSPGSGSNETDSNAGSESAYTDVYRETIGSVVSIRVTERGQGPGGRGGQGSGFVYDRNHVVTNAHVVGEADRAEVQFSRGESQTGRVVGRDRYADLAAVQVGNRPDYATPLRLAREEPAVGTQVASIGSPYSFEGTMTSGIVSGVNRFVPSPQGRYRIPNAIQTDAPVNPGNSGGPLVDLEGTVLGVINSGGGENIAFAISSLLVRRVVPALIERGSYEHPYVGVGLVDVTDVVAEANGLRRSRGLLVVRTVPGSPAAEALQASTGTETVDGFRVPTGGDVILRVNGRQVETPQAFASYLELRASPGETVTLTVLRGGSRQQVDLRLAERPQPDTTPSGSRRGALA